MKRITRSDLSAAEAARVGDELREARQALGASLEEMAERLRINRRYLVALEEGRIADLPGTAYALGFVRSYAAALGLEAAEMVRRFRDLAAGIPTKQSELVFPEPVPQRGVPAGAVIVIGAVLAIGAYVGWYNWSGSPTRVVDTAPPLPPRLEQTAQEGERLREAELAARTAPEARPVPPPSAAQAALPPPAATPGAPASQARGAPPAAPGAAPPAVATPTAQTRGAALPGAQPATPGAPPAPAPAAQPAPADAARVVLRARGESWIQLRDTRANQVLLDKVLRAGETMPIPARDGIVLTTGRAENLDILLDGQVSAALANAVGVRRGIALEPDRLQANAAAPAAPAPRPAPRPAPAAEPPAQPRP